MTLPPNEEAQRSDRGIWLLAVLGPILSGAAAWLWEAITVTSVECHEGSAMSALGPIGFLVLLLASPIAIGWSARGARPILPRILAPLILAIFIGFLSIIVGTQIWWYHHDCQT